MAQRMAGNIFNRAFVEPSDSDKSVLISYFPEFRDFTKSLAKGVTEEGPRGTRNATGVPAFAGFKPLKANETQTTPVFAGAKPAGYTSKK